MDLIERTRALADQFWPGQSVTIDEGPLLGESAVTDLARQIKAAPATEMHWPIEGITGRRLVLLELLASAINYCYWLGRHDVRPGGGSVEMYNAVEGAVRAAVSDAIVEEELEDLAEVLIAGLAEGGFPLVEERVRHVREVTDVASSLVGLIHAAAVGEAITSMEGSRPLTLNDVLGLLVSHLPGFAADPFLKRAFLFVIQLNRREPTWFADEIGTVPVPADYQLPKMLRHFGVLRYNIGLGLAIDEGRLIERGSRQECEIRAATILACDRLAKASGRTPAQVDAYLWSRRKEVDRPFHLTRTTDY
jgi:hypothetical protein